jgi:hypothetical protein
MICEPLTLAIVIFQVVSEMLDIYNIGSARWWKILVSFPTKMFYKVGHLLILCILPIRLMCGLDESMLFLDNFFSVASVILVSVYFLVIHWIQQQPFNFPPNSSWL